MHDYIVTVSGSGYESKRQYMKVAVHMGVKMVKCEGGSAGLSSLRCRQRSLVQCLSVRVGFRRG